MDHIIDELENLNRQDLLLIYGTLVAYPIPGDQVHKIVMNAREVVQDDGDYLPEMSDDALRGLLLRQCRTSGLVKSLEQYIAAIKFEGSIQ